MSRATSGSSIELPRSSLFLLLAAFLLTLLACTGTPAVAASNGEGDAGESVFFDLPSLLIRLNTPNQRATYLKAKIVLELADPGKRGRVEKMLPRVLDNIQTFLREARVEDFATSRNMRRLRAQLRLQINAAVKPADVKDVLFKKVLFDQ